MCDVFLCVMCMYVIYVCVMGAGVRTLSLAMASGLPSPWVADASLVVVQPNCFK